MIYKTKKEECKKYKTKKKTQNKQQIFRIKLRKNRFRMFGPHSKLISIVLALFKADFGHWPIWSDSTDTISFCKLARIKAESAWICKKKKKNSDAAPTRGQPCWWPHPTSGRVELWCGTLPAASVLPKFKVLEVFYCLCLIFTLYDVLCCQLVIDVFPIGSSLCSFSFASLYIFVF